MSRYTEEQINYLESVVPGKSFSEVANLFNLRFKANKTTKQIKELCKRKRILSGIDPKFQKGNQMNAIRKVVGYERITSDGYIMVKISDSPISWEFKHKLIWESENGKIPTDCVLTFLDGDKTNFEISNLKLINKNTLSRINRSKLKYSDSQTLETCILLAELKTKMNQKRVEIKI